MMKVINSLTGFAQIISILLLLVLLANVAPTGDLSQDLSFRLQTIERRLDQLQIRVELIDRAQQNQAMNANPRTSDLTTTAVLELQRVQNSLAEQVLQLQKRTLDLQKTIDQLSDRENKQEKKEPVKEEPKAKAKTTRP